MNKVIELSVSEDGNFYDITTQLCYLNEFNLNGIKLIGEELDDNLKTLEDTPTVAYLEWNWGEPNTFGGHATWIDEDGNMRFDSISVGHTKKVWVEKKKTKPVYSSEEKELPVVYCTSRIYASRFPEYSKVIRRMVNDGTLGVSWELEPKTIISEETEIEGIPNPRSTDSYEFLGYAMIGVPPAYGEMAKVLEISEEDKKINEELSSALKLDIANAKDKETSKQNPKGGNEMDKIKELEGLLSEKEGTISAMQTKLDELSAKVAEAEAQQEKTLAEEKAELEEKLVKASEKVESLSSELEELRPYKEKVDAMEAEKAEAEKAEKIKELKAMATKGGYIEEKELSENEELAKMISECDEQGVRVFKAERVLAKAEKEIETSSKDEENQEEGKLELSEETKADGDVMASFLGL